MGRYNPYCEPMTQNSQTTSTDYGIWVHQVGHEVRAYHGDTLVAVSTRAKAMHETRLPVAIYFPPEDVCGELIPNPERRTFCPFKGTASYFDLVLDGKTIPFEIATCSLTTDGFRLTFTEPLANNVPKPADVEISSFRYKYWQLYGSERIDKTTHAASAIRLSNGRKVAHADGPAIGVDDKTIANADVGLTRGDWTALAAPSANFSSRSSACCSDWRRSGGSRASRARI